MIDSCPCGSKVLYANCCEVYHANKEIPTTAEQLMRSRYSAYALKLIDYLVDTTHKDKLRSSYRTKLVATIHDIEWIGLKIVKTSNGTTDDKVGKVLFEASYIEMGDAGVMQEHSRFKKVAGKWYYYDGKG